MPKSQASPGWHRTSCSGNICKLQIPSRVDALQRQACSTLLPSSLFSLSPPSLPSPLLPSRSRPGRRRKAWEGARPTSRVPLRNEGTEAHPLSNLKCGFPSCRMPDGWPALRPCREKLCRPKPAPDQNVRLNQNYRQARRQAAE